jgi:hypothetical protein
LIYLIFYDIHMCIGDNNENRDKTIRM